jgi:hypothetical protein
VPWPADPTPVKAVERGGKWILVDRQGRKLPDSEEYSSPEKAKLEAQHVNATWNRAKKERDTREAAARDGDVSAFVAARARELALEERLLGRGGTVVWDPTEHPRNRLGEFRDILAKLKLGGLLTTPEGWRVRRTPEGFVVSNPRGQMSERPRDTRTVAYTVLGREQGRQDPLAATGRASYVVKGHPVTPDNPLHVSPEQYSAALAKIIAEIRNAAKKQGLDDWERGRIKGLQVARRIVERAANWTEIAKIARAWSPTGDADFDDGFQTGMRTAYLLHDELEELNNQRLRYRGDVGATA